MTTAIAQQSTTDPVIIGQRIRVRGLVQGVGFRPTVWRLAHEQQLLGQVLNDGEGVLIDAFGSESQLENFITSLSRECPPLARIDNVEQMPLFDVPPIDFCIVKSKDTATHTGIVADAASCPACVAETRDPKNKRFQYPFSNCTHCGPRLSIINAIPYDRQNTSMASFTLCAECKAEYDDPSDRRFHAQANACPKCGPKVWLEPQIDKTDNDVIKSAAKLLKQGFILAIKGIGGFHLACDATNHHAVTTLRQRKQRYAKPFALMARDLTIIQRYCSLNEDETTLLQSVAAPIVLLDKQQQLDLADDVAPEQNTLGFLLPYTPLHHLLLQNIDFPIIMTSGNPSNMPQCISNEEAQNKLQGIADYWLLNDRGILNRIDDSVVRVVDKKTRILRRARGFAPASFSLPSGFENAMDIIACGGELKNTFCLIKDGQAVLSQHIGDLENAATYADYEKNISLYQALYQHNATALIIDAHPEYLSSKYGRDLAEKTDLPLIEVQHHHAHIAACLAENNWPLNKGKVLGVALDGLGFGDDGALWGGEFLLADYHGYERLACFKPVALLGGSQAIVQPWRNTYAQLKANFSWDSLDEDYSDLELLTYLKQKPHKTLDAMLEKNINAPLASSCGRLFDAVAVAIGLCREQAQYEGQAAIELEALLSQQVLEAEQDNGYILNIEQQIQGDLFQIETTSLWKSILNDLKVDVSPNIIAARFHLGIINAIKNMVVKLTQFSTTQITNTVALSGGVFQNRILLEGTTKALQRAGYHVLSHSLIPANDGGLALGQATIALAQLIKQQERTLCA